MGASRNFDRVDEIIEQWLQQRPDLDVSSMGIAGRMGRLLKHLEKARGDALARFGFKEGEFDVLATLRRAGKPHVLSPTELYRSLMLTSGAMTNRVARLESAGWVERLPNPDDGRGSAVRLTKEGLRRVDEAVVVHIATQELILGGLATTEKKQLASLLKVALLALPGEVALPQDQRSQ